MPGMYTVTPLDNGIILGYNVEAILGYNMEAIITYNSSIGVMNILSQRYNGKEFLTYRLNDFDYKIKEAGGAIPGINWYILSLILLTGIISIAWYIKKKIR